jgi:hypothetical protein
MIQEEGVPLVGGLKVDLNTYVPPAKQSTHPGRVVAAAPAKVLGDSALLPEFASLPEGEA